MEKILQKEGKELYPNYPNYYQGIPQTPPQPQPQRPQQNYQMPVGLKGRPVSSIDEVRATSIDFDGSIFFFPDIANKRIYTKQINLDGTASLQVYELKFSPVQLTTDESSYVTREEFEAAMSKLKGLITPAPTEPTVPQKKVLPEFNL